MKNGSLHCAKYSSRHTETLSLIQRVYNLALNVDRRIGLASVINAHFTGNSKQWLRDAEICQNYIAFKGQSKSSIVGVTTTNVFLSPLK